LDLKRKGEMFLKGCVCWKLKMVSFGYGRKSQEQVGERVEAEDLYKDAVRVTLGGINGLPDHGLA
jgi:hypothetical protein